MKSLNNKNINNNIVKQVDEAVMLSTIQMLDLNIQELKTLLQSIEFLNEE